jgi:hypothetical protein
MKIAIVGSRTWTDHLRIMAYIDALPAGTIIISGGAQGVDSIAAGYAEARGLSVVVFLPDWDRFGKSAGMIRNRQIVDAAQEVVAFWDGESRGTKGTIDLALQAKHIKTVTVFKR